MSGTVSIYKHPKSNNIYLDINFEGKRKRKSTKLINNAANLKLVKNDVIPKIQASMSSGTFSFDNKNSTNSVLDIFSKAFFEIHKDKVRELVFYQNQKNYENKVKPLFGNRSMNSIKPMEIEKWQNDLVIDLKASTVMKIRYIFNAILEHAYKNDLVDYNPFKKVKLPKDKQVDSLSELENGNDDINPFDEEELKVMFEFTGYLGYFVFLMAATGMRPSEILALDWKDIDFEKKRIAVFKGVVNGKIDKVKTKTSARYVDIIPPLENKLREWYEIAPSKEILFVNQSKKRFFGVSIINRVFKKRLIKFGIKPRYIYQLRHTFASRYISKLSEGVNILWVSKQLGHKNISVTLETYAKFVEEDENKREDNLNKMAQIWHT